MGTIFVCGGAGFIGSNFVRYWLETYPEDKVVNYDLLTYAGNLENLADLADDPRYTFAQGDIGDRDRLVELFVRHRPDYVVNFAAESHNSRAVLDPDAFFRTNVMGLLGLIRAVRDAGVPRFHHVSTCEVYGDLALDTDDVFTETSPYRPRTPYNASKAAGDHAVSAFVETFGLPATISIACNNYGPYQFPEKVIPYFCVRALQGQRMPLYRSSQNRREWLQVRDHCRGIDLVLKKGRIGETYNLGSGVELDVEQIASTIAETLGLTGEYKEYVPDRPGLDRRYLLDSTKARAELGWTPKIPIEQGLPETIRWYRDNEHWWRRLLDRQAVDEAAWTKSPVATR